MKITAMLSCVSLVAGGAFAVLPPSAAEAATPDVLDVVSINGTTSAASAVSILPMLGSGTTGTAIPLPTTATGANQPLTLSGSASAEGQLSLSGDGRYLTLAGYAAAPGTGSVSSTSATGVPRVVGRIDAAGAVDTSTQLGADAFTGNNVRAAVTNDGSRFWVTGANGSATKAAGAVLTARLGASGAESVSSTVSSGRTVNIAGGNLYLASDKKPVVGVSRVGSGLPSSSGQTAVALAGPADPYGFAAVTLGSGSSPDTLYVADGTSGGITKYALTGSTWQAKGTIGAGTPLFGLAGRVQNGGTQLYATTLDGKKVLSAFDGSGAGAGITGSLTTVSTAASGNVVKGIAFGPGGQAAPGPAPVLAADDTVLGAVLRDSGNAALGVTVSDADSSVDLGALTVTATSSNAAVVPSDNIAVTGSGARRSVTVTPVGTGYATITLTTTDPAGRSGSTSFTYGASAAAPDTSSRWLTGAADSSAAIDVGQGYVIVADDSTNVLRLFRADRTGGPVRTWDIGARFGLNPAKGSDSMDLEAAARIGDTVWWTGSMGNSSDDGASRPNRSTLFATKLTGSGASTDLVVTGTPYKGLRNDLIAWDHANGDKLGFTDSAAPGHLTKTVDGFNVEGMEFTGDGSGAGYIGFRAPLETTGSRKLALVMPVTNLASLTSDGGPATFGAPLLWNLDGLSVRDIRRNTHGQYLVLAGSYAAGNPTYRLYTWNGDPAVQPVVATTAIPTPLGGWEAIVATPDPIDDGAAVTLVEDDGSVDFYGDGSTESKTLPLGLRKSRVDTVTLTRPAQSVAFTTTPPVPASYGDSYHVAATGGASGLPVTFAAGSSDSCTVGSATGGTDADGNGTGAAVVTLGDVGSCTITASQDGGVSYQSTTSVPQSFSVDPATPTIAWPAPDAIAYGTPVSDEQLDATANVAGTFAYDVPGGTVLGAGDHVLTATFTPNDGKRYRTVSARVKLSVKQAAQRIDFAALPDRTYGDAPSALTATGGASGQPVTFTATGSCSADPAGDGTTLTLTGAGHCTVRAEQAGTADYTAAAPVERSFDIGRATPSLTWAAPRSIVYGTPLSAVQLNAAADVDGTYDYTADDSAGDPSDRVLRAGSHALRVTFTPSDVSNYDTVTARVTLTVTKARPQLSWTPKEAALTYGDTIGSAQLNATADVAGTFGYEPVDGTKPHAGAQTLVATFTPDDTDDFIDGTTVRTTITVAKAAQSLRIADPGPHRYGDAPFTVTATGGASGSPVTLAADGPCRLGGAEQSGASATARVTLTGGGSCTITAGQDGSDDYLAAPDATRSLTVDKATPVITWPTPKAIGYGTPLSATQLDATSETPGTFDYTVDGKAATAGDVIHAGKHRVVATFSPDDPSSYLPANASVTLTVTQAGQRVTIATPADQVYGNAPLKVAVSGTAGGGYLGVKPDAGSSCTTSAVSGGVVTVTLTDAGTCGLTAQQSSTADYLASDRVRVGFVIDKRKGAVSLAAVPAKTYGAAPFAVKATASKSSAPVLLTAGPDEVCALSGTTLSLTGVGACTVTADQAGDANTYAAPTATVRFTVSYKVAVLSGQGAVRAGTAQLVRVRLTDVAGANLSSSAIPVLATAFDGRGVDGRFAYSSTSGGVYDYRVDTTGLAAGSHALTFTTGDDPVPHRVTFAVK